MNLEKVKKIHFIGIGGIGMSAVAGIAKAKGFEVSGSDSEEIYDPAKGVLDREGIPYKIGYAAENLENVSLVVVNPAVDPLNPELKKAEDSNIPLVAFPELLTELTKDKNLILVVGAHGKGTTAGLISYVLKNIEDSSFFVGAVLTDLSTNFYVGTGPYFVVEGDEYKASFNDDRAKFLFFQPNVLLINNIELDHPDLYPDLEAFKKPFKQLAQSMPANSKIIYNSDDRNVLDVIKDSKAQKIGFGFRNNADVIAGPPVSDNGVFAIKIGNKQNSFTFRTKLPGTPYAYDNLAAITTLVEVGYSPKEIAKFVTQYSGVKRRFEIIEDSQNLTIIDDYAHHPTAVKQTLDAAKQKYPGRRIVCFFEPHTYSRTKETLADLAKAFGSADLAFIAEVYPAREQKLPSSIGGEEVVAEVSKNHNSVYYVSDKKDALEKYISAKRPGDVVIVMAVGSFNTLVEDLKNYG